MSAQTLYCQKLESLPKTVAADSMCLSSLAFTQSFFESCTVGANKTGAKTEFNAKFNDSRSFKVTHFGKVDDGLHIGVRQLHL